MNVRELREAIAGLPDDSPVLLEAADHSYRIGHAHPRKVLVEGRRYSEDYGEDLTPEGLNGKRTLALVIS